MIRWLVIGFVLFAAGCAPPPLDTTTNIVKFRDVAEESGLRFTHVNGASGKYYMPEIMGSGAALFDADNDGDLDVFLLQGGSVESPDKSGGNKYFRNELIPSGKLAFVDKTINVDKGYGMGAATADFDNDGHTDLLVTNFGPNVLYRNRGDGTFEDVTAASPAIRKPGTWSTSASFFDYDRDGWQDLVILSYIDFTVAGNKKCSTASGEPDYCTPVVYRSVAAALFHNDKGRFVDVTAKAGLDRAKGPGLGVQAIDANEDGYPDLFVANDTAANHLWINQKNGTFAEKALEFGVAYSDDGLAKAGMGVAMGDYDADGREDLLVLNLMREGATLFRREGNGYRDASMATKIHALTFAFTGFGAGWIDADNDGWLDLFLANGAVTQREEQRGQSAPFREQNLLLRNAGPGKPFEDVSQRAGDALKLQEITRGAVFGDVDNDGRVDILITNNNGPARLLRNESTPAPWLQVHVKKGAGARVGLERDGAPTLWRRVHTDGSYLSASSPIVHFGLGSHAPKRVIVEWPEGVKTTHAVAGTSRRLTIER